MEIFILRPPVVGKLSLFSGMYNDALMHREDLKGKPITTQLSAIYFTFFAMGLGPYLTSSYAQNNHLLTRLHESRSSGSELEFDLSNFV